MESALKKLEDEIWKNPNLELWEKVSSSLKKGPAKYYKVVYTKGGVSSSSDLEKSSVEIYDSSMKKVARLPIFIKKGKELVGSLEYLNGLLQAPRRAKKGVKQ